jgi:type II secretory pathway pseudopilin PulG
VELLAVMALLAILSGSAFGLIRGVHERAAAARARDELAALAQAIDSWRGQYGDDPQVADAAEFYEALAGRRGPQNNVLDPPGRTFIQAGRFTLRFSDPAALGNVLLDPWGQPYLYTCFTRTVNGRLIPGFVVFSSGPDCLAKPDDPPATGPTAGEPDLSAPENADNFYSNR